MGDAPFSTATIPPDIRYATTGAHPMSSIEALSQAAQAAFDPRAMKEYTLSESRPSQVNALIHTEHSTPGHLSSDHSITQSPYVDQVSRYRNSSFDVSRSDGFTPRFPSPEEHRRSLDYAGGSTTSEWAARRGSGHSAGDHRRSVGSLSHWENHPRSASMDGSQSKSPSGYPVGPSIIEYSIGNAAPSMDGLDGDVRSSAQKSKHPSSNDSQPPPWSDLKTKAGKDRKRLPLACIACRRKKIRCSGEKPACKHCLRSRIPCVYKITTRKAAPRTDYMAMLDKRLKRMEERVIKIVPRHEVPESHTMGRAVLKPSIASGSSKTSGSKKRAAADAFGDELGEWMKPKPDDKLAARQTLSRTAASESDENSLMTEGAASLPPMHIRQHLVEVYFDCVYGQTYSLLHKPSFMRRLGAGRIPPVLMLAVCAISARFANHPELKQEPPFLRGEEWASEARNIVIKHYDQPNITILTATVLLGLHEFGTCQGGRSWAFGGMALRMAYALQLHREVEYDPLAREKVPLSVTDREIRRRTMWACFLMDRFNSSGTERPTFANEESIKIQLPIKEKFFQMGIAGTTPTLEGEVHDWVKTEDGQTQDPKENMGVAAYVIRIVALWGRVIKYLNLGGKEKDPHPMWSPKSHFAELQGLVDGFRTNMPPDLQYNQQNLDAHAAEHIANQFFFLHTVYHQIVLFMNRFAIPSAPGLAPASEMPKEFVRQCGRAALEAASRISALIRDSSEYPVTAPFFGYCAFLSSTVHVFGIFSKNAQLEAMAKQNLTTNVKYLGKMKRVWGMFHYVAESLKEIYRAHADEAQHRGPNPGGTRTPSLDRNHRPASTFQYGDWFDKYPRGVERANYDIAPAKAERDPNTAGQDDLDGLQTVETFFASLSAGPEQPPPPQQQQKPKAAKRKKSAGSSKGKGGVLDRTLSGGVSAQQQQTQTQMQQPQPPLSTIPTTQQPSAQAYDQLYHPHLSRQSTQYLPHLPHYSEPSSLPHPHSPSHPSHPSHHHQHHQQLDPHPPLLYQPYAPKPTSPPVLDPTWRGHGIDIPLSPFPPGPSGATAHSLPTQPGSVVGLDGMALNIAEPVGGVGMGVPGELGLGLGLDMAGGMGGTGGIGGVGGMGGASSAWFVPFNMEPPPMDGNAGGGEGAGAGW
ncbi:MAG: hypothetical protein M1824_005174 [Vezdaea acicularis]|nr:MAG: hypothetical protein M1824_005174 [Vezdaea acicularis]